jgi:hypothetical protein
MKWLNDIKLELQRWIYRSRRRSFKKSDDKQMLRAIMKADQHTEKTGNRLWVIKFSPGDYRICTKSQARAFFRNIRPILKINYYQINEYIIHITNKPK